MWNVLTLAFPLSLHRVFKKASPNGKVSLQQLHLSSSLTPNSCPLLGMSTDHAGPCTPPSEALRSPRPQWEWPPQEALCLGVGWYNSPGL